MCSGSLELPPLRLLLQPALCWVSAGVSRRQMVTVCLRSFSGGSTPTRTLASVQVNFHHTERHQRPPRAPVRLGPHAQRVTGAGAGRAADLGDDGPPPAAPTSAASPAGWNWVAV